MRSWRRVAAVLLSMVLVLSANVPALGADTAATMRLQKTEGTVAVTNAAGKDLKEKKGMRLYNGYGVETRKASYAYISLDGSKAAKLDASSAVTLGKVGRRLELKLTSGKLFFDVKQPLEKNESLNIRTATMVTGIRGTTGWVEVQDQFHSRLYLLDGTVTVTCTDPDTGRVQRETITAGESILSTPVADGAGGRQQQRLVKETFHEDGVPGSIREEIAGDPELEERLRENSPLDVDKLIDRPEEHRKEDEKAAEQQDREIQKQADGQRTEKVDPVFAPPPEPEPEPAPEPDPAPDPAPDPVPQPEPQPEQPVRPVVRELTDPTFAAVQAALDDTGVDVVRILEGNKTAGNLAGGALNVPSNKTLDLSTGNMTVADGTGQTGMVPAMTIDGTVEAQSGFTLTNNGTINVQSTQSLHIMGTLTNAGTVFVGANGKAGKMVVENGATINSQTGGISIAAQSELVDQRSGVTPETLISAKCNNWTNQGALRIPNGITAQDGFAVNSSMGVLTADITIPASANQSQYTYAIDSGIIQGTVTVNLANESVSVAGTSSVTRFILNNTSHLLVVGNADLTSNIALNDQAKMIVGDTPGGTGQVNPAKVTGNIVLNGGTTKLTVNQGSQLTANNGNPVIKAVGNGGSPDVNLQSCTVTNQGTGSAIELKGTSHLSALATNVTGYACALSMEEQSVAELSNSKFMGTTTGVTASANTTFTGCEIAMNCEQPQAGINYVLSTQFPSAAEIPTWYSAKNAILYARGAQSDDVSKLNKQVMWAQYTAGVDPDGKQMQTFTASSDEWRTGTGWWKMEKPA